MDRKGWIVVTSCVIGLIAWYWYYGIIAPPPAPQQPASQTAAATPTAAPSATTATTAAPTPQPTPPPPDFAIRSESLAASEATYIFSNDKGGISSVALLKHIGENQQPVQLNGSALPIGAIGSEPNEAWGGFEMTTDPTKGEAVFTRHDADGLEITKRFTIIREHDAKEAPYRVKLELAFKNTGTAAVSRPGYFVSTGGAAPVHAHDMPYYTRFDSYHDNKDSMIDVNWFSATIIPIINFQWKAAQSLYTEPKPNVTWASVSSQYFCTVVTLENAKGSSAWATRYDTHKLNSAPVYGIQGAVSMPELKIDAGQEVKQGFVIYAGPKELANLRKLNGGQDVILHFGMFGFVSEFLLTAMNWLNSIFHSYAWAIIVLTLIIKSLLWPIQNKATNEMRKMAALSPKMTEMREKYKDDPQKLNEEMMKLYREYGVNPLSGCIPMLIQIPIFFGFYTMLGSAIELRNSSFLWVKDLSQPDTIAFIPGIHFPINLLPIVMAGSMVWQMVISPKSGDAVQQRMLYFMPIIFLAFSYNYASGLALYWTTQNIFSIVQLYLTRNKPLPTLEKKSVLAKREAAAQKQKKKRL